MSATPERRERRDAEIVSIGTQMSNVMFNMKQWPEGKSFTKAERDQFAMLQGQWDKAVRKYRDSFKRCRQ